MLNRISVVLIFLSLLTTVDGIGQQQGLNTMFMYNKLGINPGYAGYHGHACLTGIYRSQWMGFEGAPESQMLSFQAPLNQQRIGLGLNLHRIALGVSSQVTLDGIYAYRIPVGSGTFSLGAQASVRNMQIDYADPRLQAVQDLSVDPGVDLGTDRKVVANFGLGGYYSNDQFYAGLSVPRMMNADIDFEENNLFISREVRHAYLMTGYVIGVNYSVDFVPQLLVRFVESAPVNVDISTSIILKEDYTFGLTYRTGGAENDFGDSIDLMASARIAKGLLMGISYDLTLSELRRHTNGSLELMMRYCFKEAARQTDFENPRYF